MDVYLRQIWRDYRLAFDKDMPEVLSIGVPDVYYRDIWLPDIYAENSKDEHVHGVTMANKMFRVYQDGTVVYSQRVRLVLWCGLDLHRFPFDNQSCEVRLLSYRYTLNEVQLRWDPHVLLTHAYRLGTFNLDYFHVGNCTGEFSTGTYPCISAWLYFTREFGYYVTQVYIPGCFIVALSWMSFWFDPTSVPGRISLGILTILTMSNQISTVASDSLPKVSYIVAIDIWIMICMVFLCGVVIEFAVVNTLARNDGIIPSLKEDHDQHEMAKNIMRIRGYVVDLVEHAWDTKKKAQLQDNFNNQMYIDKDRQSPRTEERQQEEMENILKKKAIRIDRICRVAFPIAFIACNVIYWTVFIWNGP